MTTRIRQLRMERGLTVQALADMVRVSKSHMSDMETGERTISAQMLQKIADAFKLSPVDLMDAGAVGQELIDHVRRMSRLSPENRLAVFRHAIALDPGEAGD